MPLKKKVSCIPSSWSQTNAAPEAIFKLGIKNVLTMERPFRNPQDISDSSKTSVIHDELKRLNVDIATLQEAWLANSSTLKEKEIWVSPLVNSRRTTGTLVDRLYRPNQGI